MIQLGCPSDRRLADFFVGRVSALELEALSDHLETCPECLQRLSLQSTHTPFDGLSTEAHRSGPLPAAVPRILALESLPDRLEPGRRIRDYLLLAQIGEGGMGTVFRACHERLNKPVALKVIRHGSQVEPASVARFQREMLAVGKLRHPNIVQATDAGECEGTLYLVMEFVEGDNLAGRVKAHGPFPAADAIGIFRQAAAGLQHAHDAGLIHRDLKPSNLILGPDGTVKILDLGLAFFAGVADAPLIAHDAPTVADRAAELTSPSRTLGTFDYMAPEQHRNPHDVDARADVYALGATLWFLLTGKPPIVGEALRTDQLPGALPRSLWHRLLAADKAQRFDSAADAAAALAPFGPSETRTEPSGPTRRRTRLWQAAAAAILLTGLAFAVRSWLANDPNQGGAVALTGVQPGKLPMSNDEAVALQNAWAAEQGEEVAVENSVGMKLALIPPGEFGLSSECRVRITRPYRIAATEVTRGQFRKFVEATGYITDSERTGDGGDVFTRSKQFWIERRRGISWRQPGLPDITDDHPVLLTSHNDAIAFCKWLSDTEQQTYRLPTEAEWVWAARAGSSKPGPETENLDALTEHCWLRANSGDRPHPVGRLRPNAWGLFDMHGNLNERCGDIFGSLPVGLFDDYAGATGSGAITVVGTTYFFAGNDFLARAHGDPVSATTYTGFRVVRCCRTAPTLPPVIEPEAKQPPGGTIPMSMDEFMKLQRQWAEHLRQPTRAKDRFGNDYVLIPPGGPFPLGNDCTASLTKAYYIAVREVTCAEFTRFIADNPEYKTSVELTGKGQLWYGEPTRPNRQKTDPQFSWKNPGYLSGPGYPVTYVSHDDAKAYCAWLSKVTGQRYRLPTEAEWKWAARAGTATRYYTGDTLESLADHEWIRSNAGMMPHPAGTKKTNPWGLFDMEGNVTEITGEFTVNGHRTPGHFIDPRGPASGNFIATCGGSYVTNSEPGRGAELITVQRPTVGMSKLGFRVLREVPDQ